MPVTIIKRGTAPKEVDQKAPVVQKQSAPPPFVPVENRPVMKKVLRMGNQCIYPDISVADESGKVKFMINYKKPGLWYRVVGYDDTNNVLKLGSKYGNIFDSKVDGTVPRNYFVVSAPTGTLEPSPEVLKFIQTVLPMSGGEGDTKVEGSPTGKKRSILDSKPAVAAFVSKVAGKAKKK